MVCCAWRSHSESAGRLRRWCPDRGVGPKPTFRRSGRSTHGRPKNGIHVSLPTRASPRSAAPGANEPPSAGGQQLACIPRWRVGAQGRHADEGLRYLNGAAPQLSFQIRTRPRPRSGQLRLRVGPSWAGTNAGEGIHQICGRMGAGRGGSRSSGDVDPDPDRHRAAPALQVGGRCPWVRRRADLRRCILTATVVRRARSGRAFDRGCRAGHPRPAPSHPHDAHQDANAESDDAVTQDHPYSGSHRKSA